MREKAILTLAKEVEAAELAIQRSRWKVDPKSSFDLHTSAHDSPGSSLSSISGAPWDDPVSRAERSLRLGSGGRRRRRRRRRRSLLRIVHARGEIPNEMRSGGGGRRRRRRRVM